MLQNDPVEAVARNADLVLWSRIGSDYRPSALTAALDDLRLIELMGIIRPAADIALFQAEMQLFAEDADGLPDYQHAQARWVEANDGCRRDILERLRQDGPLTARELPDTCDVPWQSSGWNNNRNVRLLLDMLVLRGEVAAAGFEGRERLWDLAGRIYPELTPVPLAEARRMRDQRRLRSLGIARARTTAIPVDQNDVGSAGETAVIEGVRGTWQVDPAYLSGTFSPRAALLSPLDRLVYDRKRMSELFEFDYQLEMFKPAAKRRWGYWALPILYGDRLIGKIDATADRRAGVLRVEAVHRDLEFTAAMTHAVEVELRALARWLELELLPPAG